MQKNSLKILSITASLLVCGTAFAAPSETFKDKIESFKGKSMKISEMKGEFKRPMIMGRVVSITGNQIIIANRGLALGNTKAATSTYTIDTTNAKFISKNSTTTISSISVGDNISVEGTKDGSNVIANLVILISERNPEDKSMHMGKDKMELKNSAIVVAKVVSIDGNTINIVNDKGQNFIVDTSSSTIRKAGIKNSNISNIEAGDRILVQGKTDGTQIQASLILDNTKVMPEKSQGKRPNIFQGIGNALRKFFRF